MARYNKIFRIHLPNFEKYNPGKKKTYKKTMIANNFTDDPKLSVLPLSLRWMYLGLVLTCGDHGSDVLELSENTLRDMLESSKSVTGALDTLQSFQLLTYENITPNIKEYNIKESKVKEYRTGGQLELTQPVQEPPKPSKKKDPQATEENRLIWNAFFDAYRERYGIEPVRNLTVNSQVSALRKKLGTEEAIKVVRFYLTHNDSYFLKNTHTFGHCLSSAETLRTQMLRGKPITGNDVRGFEQADRYNQALKKIESGEL